ncbi:MAG: alpha/beta hydrolase [Comamonadaceae bacterium]|nr:MAG: alpha/beta hydrolase [Comamonadaceae bacterium]
MTLHRTPGRHRAAASIATLLAAAVLAGCGALRRTTVPIETRLDRAACTPAADTLVVMLPGAYSESSEFVTEGFVPALRERRIAADVLRVEAHLGYYNRRSIVDRLEADVFEPARRPGSGYRSVWVVGISIGGFGALLHEAQHPGRVDGIVLIAPYLGQRLLSTDISVAGGLARWNPPMAGTPLEEAESGVWRWLQAQGVPPAAAGLPPRVPVYLGYGLDDRFAFSHRLLADALPAQRVFTTPGGHDWPEWRRLWGQALDVLPLPVCAPG